MNYHYPIPDLCSCDNCRDDRNAEILRYVMHADALPVVGKSEWWLERREFWLRQLES